MMNEILTLVIATMFGAVLGALFFGGLWWTVRKGLSSAQPFIWFLGSILFRMSIVLAGFYFVCSGQCNRLLFCLLGFGIAAPIVIWLTSAPAQNSRLPEVNNAS